LSHSDGGAYLPMTIPVRRDGQLVYLLTVEIDPSSIHRLALERYPSRGVVSAIVDRRGRFISRSLDHNRWVGRLGSVYLQAAAKRGGEGLYKNITLEGVPTYTAYVSSAANGWSTHVALSATPFDAARLWSNAIWIFVALASAALSALLMWIAFRDLAEARGEQQRMLQAQKMEAVGHLTGGIAHDFNNLLTAIIGGLDLFLRRSDPADQNRRFLKGALEAAQRGAKLTSRLLAFSRTQSLSVETVDIKSTLDDISQLLDQSLGPNIICLTIVADDARWVSTDRNQLELAFLNLAVNGRDAMPDGGTLTIEAKRVNRRRNGNPMSYVSLSVTDTGLGMAPHVRSQAFDPFFTTKDASKGTGLGLAQVYALARQSGGDAEIVSEPGNGTTVCLLLPLAVDPPRPDAQADQLVPNVVTAAGGEGNRILVVDDDDAVRQIIVENLRSGGYVVFESPNGEDALAALESIDPDLLVLDFLMPGLNGAEVARRARELRPHQKLLMVSGHMDSVLLDEAVYDVPVLRKPFDARTLAQQVAGALSPDSPSSVATEAK
ncbi:MAG: response regulator, partial [bacterium]|nr:response regulator [bacterium]